MSDQKTLPCPFCSSAAEVKSAVVDGKEYSNVSCSKTTCPGFNDISHQRTTKISVKLWNARTADKYELEADNSVLISIVERNIESMHSAARLLRLEMKNGASYIHTLENIIRLEDNIDRSRKFLNKLFQEGSYPLQQ